MSTVTFSSNSGGILTQAIVNAGIGLATNVIIEGYTSIGGSAFENRTNLISVTIGNSVTRVGNGAFYNCGITSLTIGNSVTRVGNGAFYNCSKITSVTIPNSVTTIDYGAFYNCGITSLTIGNSVTTIAPYAFRACSKITSVTIPNSVTRIGEEAFGYCSKITSLTIGNSVTTIAPYTFTYCGGITSLTIPNSVTFIGSRSFNYCGITSLTIPNSVTTIESLAFSYCSNLTSLTIPKSVTFIGEGAFAAGGKLTSVVIKNPSTITTVSTNSFENVSYKNSSITFFNTASYNDLSSTWKTISTYYASQVYIPPPIPPTIIFPPINATYGDSPATISYTSNSLGAVTFTCSNTSIATISGSTITFVGAGSATITATQEETDYYLSETTTTNLFVNKAIPLLSNFNILQTGETFPIEPPQSDSDGSFIYTSSNTQVATISGNLCTALSIGTTTITANQSESSNYYSGQISSIWRISNICFPAGTPIYTDQGVVNIEKINTNINTIDNKKIVAITQIYSTDDYLVCFENNSLGNNIPSQKTIISKYHGIYYNGELRRAYTFIKKYENVNKIKYTGEILYNVLMEEHYKIRVNNMICETLDPTNDIAKTYL